MIKYDANVWTDHLFDIRGTVVKEIGSRVLLCVAWSGLVYGLHRWATHVRVQDHWGSLEIPSTAHSLIGTALGLLLVIRTNASYDRFWEGRKMWGGMVNETRNLARLASVMLQGDKALLAAICRWTAAFAWATKFQLRGERGLGPLAKGLPEAEVAATIASAHPPTFAARAVSRLLYQARERGLVGEMQHLALDANVQQLVDYMGACERIQKTPLPFAYAVHLRRALIIFCWTLPFVLVHTFGWATVPATLIVAYVFFGIEEIGVEIENPFGSDENDLPLEQICETIQRDVLALAE